MRKEFSPKTRREAWTRCKKGCEACGINLEHKPREFDHIIPANDGGDNSLENCKVLCVECHKEKTFHHDLPAIAKSKRIADKHQGIRIKSRGFQKREPQRTASRPLRMRTITT